MPERELVVCKGECFTIEWGPAGSGECQAREYYEEMVVSDRQKALALFVRMADRGRIFDKTKFTKETDKLYAFKPQPHRFFCFFVSGKRIIIVTAYRKQSEKAPKREINRAEAIRASWLHRFGVEGEDTHGED